MGFYLHPEWIVLLAAIIGLALQALPKQRLVSLLLLAMVAGTAIYPNMVRSQQRFDELADRENTDEHQLQLQRLAYMNAAFKKGRTNFYDPLLYQPDHAQPLFRLKDLEAHPSHVLILRKDFLVGNKHPIAKALESNWQAYQVDTLQEISLLRLTRKD